MSYERWCADRNSPHGSPDQWRDEVVAPYFQRRFDSLKVDEDGRLYGVRGDVEEKIDDRFYDPDLLHECLSAKCPGQGWQFALGCCFRQYRR